MRKIEKEIIDFERQQIKEHFVRKIKEIALKEFIVEFENKIGLKDFNCTDFQELKTVINNDKDFLKVLFKRIKQRQSRSFMKSLKKEIKYRSEILKITL